MSLSRRRDSVGTSKVDAVTHHRVKRTLLLTSHPALTGVLYNHSERHTTVPTRDSLSDHCRNVNSIHVVSRLKVSGSTRKFHASTVHATPIDVNPTNDKGTSRSQCLDVTSVLLAQSTNSNILSLCGGPLVHS